jgi:hypothetical protein
MDKKKQLLNFASPTMCAKLQEYGISTKTTYFYVRYLHSEIVKLNTLAFDHLHIYADFDFAGVKKDYMIDPAYSIADLMEILPIGVSVQKEARNWYCLTINKHLKFYGERMVDLMAEAIIELIKSNELNAQTINYKMNRIYG